jgi:hypothetical protein
MLKTKQMTFLEKYDLFHSIAWIGVIAFSYPIAALYLYLLPPETSCIFITFLFLIPQLFNAIVIYKHSIKKQQISLFKKIINCYSGSFIISSFVTVVQLKATYNYLLNIPQGWKVTQKGFENSDNWLSIIKNNKLYLVISILFFASSIISWELTFGSEWIKLIYYLPQMFISINLFLSIILFGKSGRFNDNSTYYCTIDAINNINCTRLDLKIEDRFITKEKKETKKELIDYLD